jgi:Cu/Ag efflux protein CusF
VELAQLSIALIVPPFLAFGLRWKMANAARESIQGAFMKRHATLLLSLLLCTSALLGQTSPNQQPLAQGIVSSVDRNAELVYIQGDQIAIKTTGARIFDLTGDKTLAAVKPGQHIATVIHPGTYTASQPLPAKVLQILTQPIGSLTGNIEAIDLNAKRFTLLGRSIGVNDGTVFQGVIPEHDPDSLAELQVGETVHVSLDGSHSDLVAQRVFVIVPSPDRSVMFNGTVLSVEGDTWRIDNPHFPQFRVTSSTSIQGTVGPGSMVTVSARIDGTQVTAISIAPFSPPRPRPTNPFTYIIGILTARETNSITINNGPVTLTFGVTSATRFVDDPKVGDNVRVQLQRQGDQFTAISVEKMTGPLYFLILDIVHSIGPTEWKIGVHTVRVTSATTIDDEPQVGDRVRVVGERQADGVIIARTIDKP